MARKKKPTKEELATQAREAHEEAHGPTPRLRTKEHAYWEKVQDKRGRKPHVRPPVADKTAVRHPPKHPGGMSRDISRAICPPGSNRADCLTVPNVRPYLDEKNFKYTTGSTVKAALQKQSKEQKKALNLRRKASCELVLTKKMVEEGKTKPKFTGYRCIGTKRSPEGHCATYANRGGRPTVRQADGTWSQGEAWDFNLCKTTATNPCRESRVGCVVQLVYRGGRPHLRFCTDQKNKAGHLVPVKDYREAMRVASEACRAHPPVEMVQKTQKNKKTGEMEPVFVKNKKTGKMEPKMVGRRRAGMPADAMQRATAKGKPLTSYRLGDLEE